MAEILSPGSEIGYVLSSDFIEGIIVRVVGTAAMQQLRIGQLIVIEYSATEKLFAQVENLRTSWYPELRDQPKPIAIPTNPALLQEVFIEKEIAVRAVKMYQ
ncbi:hypothetical protein KBB08_03865, partial [Candidatus Gracilibacteria bacterium]|nr:hypothetical protein [Candidatus Gracilibacteria bacterium]